MILTERLKKLLMGVVKQEKLREEIAVICSKTLNSQEYERLPNNIKCIIEDLCVMDEVDGRKEEKIFHMKMEEIKNILKNLEK